MNKFFCILLWICFLANGVSGQEQNFVIKGSLGKLNVPVAKAYVSYELEKGKSIRDSGFIENGNFVIKGKVPKALKAILYISPSDRVQKIPASLDQREIYLVAGTSTIQGPGKAKDAILGGTALNKELQKIDEIRVPYEAERYRLHRIDVDYEGDPDTLGRNKVAKAEMEARRSAALKDFILSHLNSLASMDFLFEAIDPAYHLEEAKRVYNLFGADLRKSDSGKLYEKLFAVAIGVKAPDFKTIRIDGTEISLSDYRGGYVLLDFWASWCMPCRAQNPALIKIYEKYKDKGYQVLGVSLDQGTRGREMWLKAIAFDKLPWDQASDLKGFSSTTSTTYQLTYVPTSFLIDPNGVIIAKNLHGEDLENKLKEIYGK